MPSKNKGKFQKGKSGNPAGRPRKFKGHISKSVEIVWSEASEKPDFFDDGRMIQIKPYPLWSATAQRVMREALTGKRCLEETRAIIALISDYQNI